MADNTALNNNLALNTSSKDVAAVDRRLLEQLFMMMLIDSLRRWDEVSSAGTGDDDVDFLKEIAKEDVNAMGRNQSAFSHERLDVTQRLLNSQLRRLMDKREDGRAAVQSLVLVSSDQQLIDVAATHDGESAADAAAKEKRHEQNKVAAATQKKTRLKSKSWSGGFASLIAMVAFGSMTLISPLSLILQSDASGEGEAPPALPPSASVPVPSIRRQQKDHRTNIDNAASTSPHIVSPLPAVELPPVFSLAAVTASNNRMKSDDLRTSTCLDTPGWKDIFGEGCDYYEEYFDPGCPTADNWAGEMGPATIHCCFCQGQSSTLPTTKSSFNPSSSPSISSNPTQFCVDTPMWEDASGHGCDWYEKYGIPGCPYDYLKEGIMGAASEHCCICRGGIRTCEDYRSKCQEYSNVLGIKNGTIAPLCEEAESCSCGAEDQRVAFVIDVGVAPLRSDYDGDPADIEIKLTTNFTVGLYSECKCNFWSRHCEETGTGGEACDFAAEYCCGDLGYSYPDPTSDSLSIVVDAGFVIFQNSPACYCDFSRYARNEFGHAFEPKTLNISKELKNPCAQLFSSTHDEERASLEAIYEKTNGEFWTENDGWMSEKVHHCQWYGISCDVEGYVTSIDLRDNNLEGQFPVYTHQQGARESFWRFTKYGLANLYKLEIVRLANNKLSGTVEHRPLYNLLSLAHFDVSGNQLSGEVDALVTPSITNSDFSNNNFTSIRRFEKYKGSYQKLQFCDVSNNAIHINAADLLDNIPPNIEQFFAQNNQIYGSLPESINLPKLRHLDMSNNALSGSLSESLNNLQQLRQCNISSNALSGQLPSFEESFLSLQMLDLSNQTNGFTGSIPEDTGKFQSLEVLNLANNKLAGSIPPSIGNMAVLEVFDLSNNILISSIPPELGKLEALKYLDLSKNTLSGVIPSEIGKLQGASLLLEGNLFRNTSKAAPLSLCLLRGAEDFDLANETALCPIERNALSDFHDSANGAEWTDKTNWQDEYVSYCDWHGVTCDNDTKQVIKLNLSNNGLSGRLSESIGKLTSIEELDLGDNDIKGSIPTEIGLLSNLTYLRLSYNAFTGTAPAGLGELAKLQLLQLQSNRITEMPYISKLDESVFDKSTFVTDCGVPSAFEEPVSCENCTMCCNANEDCYPQEDTRVEELGFKNYSTFAIVLFAGFVICCGVVHLYFLNKRKHEKKDRRSSLSMTMKERRNKKDAKYALSRIGKDSVYSYFVTESPIGWFVAFATLVLQALLLIFFIWASEANLQDDKIDIQFSWKCPRDSYLCRDTADLTGAGWFIFAMLMIAHLAKDSINGSKLIYHSSKVRHSLGSRIRYFIGGVGLCSITLLALYVSTVYNKAIATSNTEIIVNSVIVLFVMDLDERIFATLEAWNENWTSHASSKSASTLELEAENRGAIIEEMKLKIALQTAQIADQQEDIEMLRSQQEGLMRQKDSLAAAAAAAAPEPQSRAKKSLTVSFQSFDFEDSSSDTDAGRCGQSTRS